MHGLSALVEVVERHEGPIPVFEIRGELDASNSSHALARVLGGLGADTPGLVIDLSSTRYLDSAGVRILFELARRLRGQRRELRIVVPSDGIVRRVLVLTALGEVVPLDVTLDDAVAALQARF